MGRLRLQLFLGLCCLLVATIGEAGSPGVFRGTVVMTSDEPTGWVYIKGRNGSIRLVDVSRASYPRASGVAVPKNPLAPGTEVRVTAEQDAEGRWRATEVEVLSAPGKHRLSDRNSSR